MHDELRKRGTRRYARPLSDLAGTCLSETFARQGFASAEIVTRWAEIAGPEIAEHSEPLRIQWPRGEAGMGSAATLVLRVEGPAAIEIQHLSGVILERVNRFFGWPAVGRLALRQAPLARRAGKAVPPTPDSAATAAVAARLPETMDGDLRQALARLGAAIKRT
ncbi:MAG: DUF721 domain-containing protein [Rhizobiales bacterium]|nr:DUF721 domain-containing protein [Hyphomicrobiales bacterium]